MTERLRCPGCDIEMDADDLRAQSAHMTAAHPTLIEERLWEAGFVRDDTGAWIDPWASDG